MKRNPLEEISGKRKELILILLSAIFLAIGIEFVASWAFDALKPYGILLSIISVLIILLPIFGITRILLGSRNRKLKLDGFILYDTNSNTVFDIYRYHYSHDLSNYLTAAFKENPAFKYHWDKEPITSCYQFDGTNHTYNPNIQGNVIIREASEYWILSELSTHLTDYFNGLNKTSEARLKEYSRKDIPEMLLENRFLEMFSKPMKDRPGFAKDHDDPQADRVVAAFSDGLIFEKFELVLPEKSKISKTKNQLRFETPKFDIGFSINFDAGGHNLPYNFEEHYLGRKFEDRLSSFCISIGIEVDFKATAFLSTRGLEYYHWIDSFIERIISCFDEEHFFKKIQWEGVSTVFEILEKAKEVQQDASDNADKPRV